MGAYAPEVTVEDYTDEIPEPPAPREPDKCSQCGEPKKHMHKLFFDTAQEVIIDDCGDWWCNDCLAKEEERIKDEKERREHQQ